MIRINALIINPLERSVRVISSAYDTQTLRIKGLYIYVYSFVKIKKLKMYVL